MGKKNNKNTENFKSDVKETTDGYTNSMQDMWDDYVSYIRKVKKVAKDEMPIVIKKKQKDKTLCDIYYESTEWVIWIGKIADSVIDIPIKTVPILCRALGESVEYALEITQKGVEFATNWLTEKLSNITTNSKWFKKIVKFLKSTLLYFKQWALQGKLWSLKILKNLLEKTANGKIANWIQNAYADVINILEKTFKILNQIMSVINKLVESIAGYTLDGGLMGFFITPKTLAAGILAPTNNLDMKPINANQDIYSNIADAIVNPIEESARQAATIATSTKSAAALAEITKNAATLAGDEIVDIPDTNVELEKTIDLTVLRQLIITALNLLCSPEALPKYERLHPLNINFLIWLITSFEPTMKKCFGIPTFP